MNDTEKIAELRAKVSDLKYEVATYRTFVDNVRTFANQLIDPRTRVVKDWLDKQLKQLEKRLAP